MYHIYGIKNCDTMKKALIWLDTHRIPYIFHNYKTEGITQEQLITWFQLVDWSDLINTRGTTYRQLDPKQKARLISADEAMNLMQAYPSIIKRPVIIKADQIQIGFNAEKYAVFTSGASRDK